MATHSSILAWRIPWTEDPGRYSLWGCKESDTTEGLSFTSLHFKDLQKICEILIQRENLQKMPVLPESEPNDGLDSSCGVSSSSLPI